jgi:methionyl-tRNA formyltransferase
MDLTAGSYFGGRKPSDGRIDWNRSAIQIYNLIRGVTHPYPGAFTTVNGEKVIIWSAWPLEGSAEAGRIVSLYPLLVGTGSGILEIRSLQADGSDESDAATFLKVKSLKAVRFE